MEIPYTSLKAEVLDSVIEEYVTREGTDYGAEEFTLEEKVSQVRQQLERGQVTILYNPDDHTCSIK